MRPVTKAMLLVQVILQGNVQFDTRPPLRVFAMDMPCSLMLCHAQLRRLHLRKCQCREKTPPCRNCPKCKDNVDIMSLSDIQAQFSVCQLKFRCEICSCKCAPFLPVCPCESCVASAVWHARLYEPCATSRVKCATLTKANHVCADALELGSGSRVTTHPGKTMRSAPACDMVSCSS